MIVLVAIGVLSYLIGSVPVGYVIGRAAGIDIQRAGSGNIGATNVLRVMGRRFGYTVFALDFLKGVLAVIISLWIINRFRPGYEQTEVVGIAAGVLSVVGHVFPVWLGFKGGKGVATSAGALFGLMPLAAVLVLLVWFIVFQTTKYVSVASIVAAIALPIIVRGILYWRNSDDHILLYFSVIVAVLIVWRHRSNISRLQKGSEESFRRK